MKIIFVIWRRKYFVVLFPLAFTFIAVLFLYFPKPNTCTIKATFSKLGLLKPTPDNGDAMSVPDYEVFRNTFYSTEFTSAVLNVMSNKKYNEVFKDYLSFRENVNMSSYPELLNDKIKAETKMISLIHLSVMVEGPKDGIELMNELCSNALLIFSNTYVKNVICQKLSDYRNSLLTSEFNGFNGIVDVNYLQKILEGARKIVLASQEKDASKATFQIDVKTQSDYIPIPNQIDMLQMQIVKATESLSKNKITAGNYSNLISVLSILKERLSSEKNSRVSHSNILKEIIDNEKSDFVKTELNKVILQAENIINLNHTTSYYYKPTKFKENLLLVFFITLLVSLAYVIVENKFKEYSK